MYDFSCAFPSVFPGDFTSTIQNICSWIPTARRIIYDYICSVPRSSTTRYRNLYIYFFLFISVVVNQHLLILLTNNLFWVTSLDGFASGKIFRVAH